MVNRYLLDSDILIWVLRRHPEFIALLRQLKADGELAVSAASVMEVQGGVRPGEELRVNTFLDGLVCLAVDRRIANKAGEYIRTYRARGITLGVADSMIAATAVLNDFTLVTLNVSHFPMPEIRLLRGTT